jgi:FixJ family two-component response regulator
VHLFTSAQALLEHEAFGEIDCLISDIGMPAIDGFDLERMARAARPELPVILITGRLELIKGRQMTALGENRTFLLKPFSERALLGAIDDVLAPRPQA